MIHQAENVCSLVLPGSFSKAGDSGASTLVRTTCKAVKDEDR